MDGHRPPTAVGVAFAGGALAAVVALVCLGPTPGAQLFAPALTPTTAARLTQAIDAPLPLISRAAAVHFPLSVEERESADPSPEMASGAAVPTWTWSVTVLAAAIGAVLGFMGRWRGQRAGWVGLEAVVVPAEQEWGMASIREARRQLTRGRRDLLALPSSEQRKHMAVVLSKELRQMHNVRSLVVRKGDRVRVLGGRFKGAEGKVVLSDIPHLLVHVEGMVRKKNNGTTVPVPMHPSQLEIIDLLLEDKTRVAILERRAKGRAEEAERRAKMHSVALSSAEGS